MDKYKLKNEHKKMFPMWRDKWIKNAFSTEQLKKEEIPLVKKYVSELYKSANLIPPPDHRIVIVSSPFIARFASGFAAWIWYCRKNKKEISATRAAIDAATRNATNAATRAATFDATNDTIDDAIDVATNDTIDDAIDVAIDDTIDVATNDAISAATNAATLAATNDATRAATNVTTNDAIYAATSAATRIATSDATSAATRAATNAATNAATRAATFDATNDAIDDAIDVAIDDAIDVATNDAIYDATDAATRNATRAATDDAIRDDYKEWYFINGGINGIINVAKKFGNIHSLFACSNKVYRIYQGGNCWSGWLSFITFFRYIVKLNIDYSKWNAYEKLGEMTGFRFMHEKFCIVSEKPIKLTIDDQNRPHCDDGPYCEWKDGSKLYCINGVRVPMWLVEKPRLLTIDKIQKQENVEVQRIMIERYGVSKYLVDIDAKLLDMDSLTLEGSAPRCLMEDKFGNRYLVGTDGSTKRVYHMRVENVETCVDAHNQLCGFNEKCLIAEA